MSRGRVAGVVGVAIVTAGLGMLLVGRGAGSPIAAAATKTADAGGAHVSFSLALRSSKLGADETLRMRGSGAVGKSGAEVTVDLGSLANVLQMPGAPSSVHAILVSKAGDELAFVHATPMPSFTGGKGWIEVDLSTLASAHGIDLAALAAAASAETPTQMLDLLRSAGATVTDLGPATVAGTSTTHYRILVDVAEVAKAGGLPSSLTGNLGSHDATKAPVNVWIGRPDGLIRRFTLVLRHGATNTSFSVSLSDYGANVSVSPPPSSNVFDATSLLSMLGA